jgi:predicted nucleotidyltransferase
MGRDEALAKLRRLEGSLRSQGVAHLYLFGSVARDEAAGGSDVDLAFELTPGARFDAFIMGGICMDLMDALGAGVDLVDRHTFSPRFAKQVEPDLVQIF